MSLSTLGRRYERLLFFAAPLSLASILALFVTFAIDNQAERATARCYESAADLLDRKMMSVMDAWMELNKKKKSSAARIDYNYTIRRSLIDVSLPSKCYQSLLDQVEAKAVNGPVEFVSILRQDARKLFATKLKYPGVDIPEKVSINLIGATVEIELPLFARLLQIVLAPLLLLWLGSLYNTRHRETLLIEKAKTIAEIFPHLVNVYPAFRYPEPKRRSYLQPHLSRIFCFAYSCVRTALVALFVVPPVLAYLGSIVLLDSSNYGWVLYTLGFAVFMFACSVLLAEFLVWHASKSFPGVPLVRARSD